MTTGTKRNSRRATTPETKPATPPDPRAEYIAGLRMLADLLEQNPDLKAPDDSVMIAIFGANQRERLAAWTRALPGEKRKGQSGSNGDILAVTGKLRGLNLRIICDREEVCERVVVGTKTVVETVPDPEYVAAAPLVERETVKEIVEWVCHPVLADEPKSVEPVGSPS